MPGHVLFVQAGSAHSELVRAFGDFDAWFRRAGEGLGLEWTVVRPFAGEPLPDPRTFEAVLVSGSYASVNDPSPWVAQATRWARAAVEGGTPFLGVCFGHQLLAQAFGAHVRKSPLGFQIGTYRLTLTEEGRRDALLGSLGSELRGQQTHGEEVVDLPREIRCLAIDPWTAVQAIGVGPRAWGVQYHPEMTEAMVEAFAGILGRQVESLLPSPTGAQVLRTFLTRFALAPTPSGSMETCPPPP